MTGKLYCYLFEAISIQSWIFKGGRLRDAVGASALLDDVCRWSGDDYYEDALKAAKLAKPPQVARRAGGGLYLFHTDQKELARVRMLFLLKLRCDAPDLPYCDGIGSGANYSEAYSAARAKLDEARNAPVPDPLRAGPFVLAAPRTGAPAVDRDEPEKGGEILDAGLKAKRANVRGVRTKLEERFDPGGTTQFPVEFSEEDAYGDGAVFPFVRDNRYVGLLHADGNGMGAVLLKLGAALGAQDAPSYTEGFRIFSQTLAQATEAAVQVAVRTLKASSKDVWPIRPLILGGDDLSAILRGDYAIPFATEFLRAFEEETAAAFDSLRAEGEAHASFWRLVLPPRLSAGAGIVFVNANQPFAQAYVLAENLAKTAKDRAKDWLLEAAEGTNAPPAATIAFHRITSTVIPARWADVLETELSSSRQGSQFKLTANPYVVTTDSAVNALETAPRIERLEHLCHALANRNVARGPLRSLTPQFLVAERERGWQRMIKMARERDPAGAKAFEDAMRALGCGDGPFRSVDGATPVLDALNWIAVARERQQRMEASDVA